MSSEAEYEEVFCYLAKRMFFRNLAEEGTGYDMDPVILEASWGADPLLREFWITQIRAIFSDLVELSS